MDMVVSERLLRCVVGLLLCFAALLLCCLCFSAFALLLLPYAVIPAKAGIALRSSLFAFALSPLTWKSKARAIPAFAGMTI
ncbi:MAG: hypothetical protein ACN6RK_12085 [Stenotrophomonas sp.]